MRRVLSDLLWALAFLIGLPAPELPQSPVQQELVRLVGDSPLRGVIVVLDREGRTWEASVDQGPDEPIGVGSARKWLIAATVLMLVDEGRLSLDEPIARWLPRWQQPYKEQITLRMLLSHTSGLPSRPPPGSCSGALTLAACIDRLADLSLRDEPGTRFHYSSMGFNVAARVAEVASGTRWQDLLQRRLLDPLGMHRTGLRPAGPGLLDMAGELWSTPTDFARFLRLLLDGGQLQGRSLLSPEAIAEMERNQTRVHFSAAVVPEGLGLVVRGYGLGMWRSVVDDRDQLELATAHGKGGFLAWLDRRTGTAGVLALQGVDGPVEAPRGFDALRLMERLSGAAKR
jgi:CubicO group peptidase (beta-lactamase class C family)